MEAIYLSCVDDVAKGNIVFETDTFKMALVKSTYTFSNTHTKRSNIEAHELDSIEYPPGGWGIPDVTTILNTASDWVEVNFPAMTTAIFSASDIAAGIIYKSRGGAANLDELVAYAEFVGGPYSVTDETFTAQGTEGGVGATAILYLKNS